MKMAVFWVVAPCRLVDVSRHFITTETPVNFYQTTGRNNPAHGQPSSYSQINQ
jgi:hypothetical protein